MKKSALLKLQTRRTPQEELTLAIEDFLSSRQAMNCSAHTILYYRNRLHAFTAYLENHELAMSPHEISPQVVRDFLTEQSTKLSPSTAHHSRLTLSVFCSYLLSEGLLEVNPIASVERIRQKRTVIDTFSQEQIGALLAMCGKDFVGARDRAIMLLLLDAGLRVSELCGIMMHDIDWTEQTVLVLGKGNKERKVPFGTVAKQALLNYRNRRGDLPTLSFFVTQYGDGMNRHRVNAIIEARAKVAKIAGVRCSPHTFRHTCAVMYLRNGGDVFSLQKLLGHTDLAMTRRYAELSQSDVLTKHRKFSPGDALPQRTRTTSGRERIK